MPEELTSGLIKRSIQRFTDYASDLMAADMNTFGDRLNMFTDFCLNDEVFRSFHAQITRVPNCDFDEWYAEREASRVAASTGRGSLLFPTGIEQRLSILYQLLFGIQTGKVPFLEFTMHYFVLGTGRYDAYILAFNETVTAPLVRELGYRLEELGESLPDDRSAVVLPSVIQIIHQATNVIQQNASGHGISQSASLTANPEIAALLDDLRAAIVKADLPPAEAIEAQEVVAAIAVESFSQRPKIGVLKALLRSLPSTESILAIAYTIIEIAGKLFG